MAEFPLTLTFATAYEHDQYVANYAGDFLSEYDVFPYAHDDCLTLDEHRDCILEDEALEFAEERGYVIPDPKDAAEIHDAWHTGAIRWCEIGNCAYVYY